tara:strand:+ start:19 stop:720 length:702 start_codon:yes stop_codon:yes gene_type:complete
MVLLGILLVAFAAWWFLVRSDAPPAPEISLAAETAAASGEAGQSSTADPEGIWIVDDAIGSFQDYTSTWVGYRIDEVLGQGIGSTTAVGRTPLVSGSVEIDDGVLLAAEVRADLRGLKSDRVFRDGKVSEALGVDRHPEATFILGGPLSLAEGETETSVDVAGTLTVNGVAAEVVATLEATLVDGVLTIVGSLPFLLVDHGIEAPSASIVVSVEDHGLVEFQLFLTQPGQGPG